VLAAKLPLGGLSRRTASALHGPWPRLIERSGATRLYYANGEDEPGHRCDEARQIAANIAKLPQGAAEKPTGLHRPHFRYDLKSRHFAELCSLTS
jgi:hypothetical protein